VACILILNVQTDLTGQKCVTKFYQFTCPVEICSMLLPESKS